MSPHKPKLRRVVNSAFNKRKCQILWTSDERFSTPICIQTEGLNDCNERCAWIQTLPRPLADIHVCDGNITRNPRVGAVEGGSTGHCYWAQFTHFAKYYQGVQIMLQEMGGTCNMHGRWEISTILVGKFEEKGPCLRSKYEWHRMRSVFCFTPSLPYPWGYT
jgi:hypothetical protein